MDFNTCHISVFVQIVVPDPCKYPQELSFLCEVPQIHQLRLGISEPYQYIGKILGNQRE